MKKNLVNYIVNKRLFVYLLILFIAISGGMSYLTLPKQNFPEVVFPVAVITAVYPGASAEDMEELVTDKIEDEIIELEGYDTSRSQTMDSLSIVMVQLDMNMGQAAVDERFDELRRKMNDLKASLPKGLVKLDVNTEAMDTSMALIAITGEGYSSDVLAQKGQSLKEALQDLSGIKKVDVLGKKESRVNVKVDLSLLNHLNMSLADLAGIIQAQNSILPTGSVWVEEDKITVHTNGRIEDVKDLKNMIVCITPDGQSVIKLSDVASIELSPDEELAGYYYNGQSAVLVALYAEEGNNVINMGSGIRQQIEQFEKIQPTAIQVREVYFQPDVVSNAINGFQKNLMASIALVLLVVMVGMNVRNGLVVSLAIPLIMLINFMVMKILHLEVQFVSLAALIIVLGMLVDNSIVVSDAIQTRLNSGLSSMEATVLGTKDVAVPVFVSMLTTVAGFLSLLTLSGAYKQLAFSLPVVIITCLVSSFIVSVTITPLISYLALKPHNHGDGKIIARVTSIYDYIFDKAFRHKAATFTVVLLVLVFCSRFVLTIEPSIVGKVNKDVVTIDIINYTENNIHKTSDIVEQVQAIIEEQPEIRYHFESVGTVIPRYDYSLNALTPLPQNGQMLVRIDLEKSQRFATTGEMVTFLQKELNHRLKGGRVIVDELGVVNLNTKPIELKVFADDLATLNQGVDKITKQMGRYNAIKNIDEVKDMATYNYYIDMDMNKLSTLALSKAEVQNELNLALMGRVVSIYRNNGKEYDIHLSGHIDDISTVEQLKVKSTLTGRSHGIKEYSKVALKEQISSISHIDGRRGKVIGAYTETWASPVAIQSMLEKDIENLDLPEGIQVVSAGEKGEFKKILLSIGKAAFVSMILILLILVFQFMSLKKAFLVLVSVPFGAIAGITGLYFSGQPLSFFALLGVLSLFGCALANAIVLIEYIENEVKLGHDPHTACRNAGKKRFRPILMSTMTTVLGLIPLALGGDVVFKSMASLLIVGLTVSMMVNLILVQ